MHPIIVGIDPGTTCAFAAISLDFSVLKVKSKRNYSLSKLILDIYKEGNPIIVGTDKKQVPNFIKDFSQKTGAKVHRTKYDTKKGEKKLIVKENGFSDFVKNAHETDALASAIYAYNEYKPLINKINKYTTRYNKQNIKDKILVDVLNKEISIKKAAAEIEKKPKINVKKPKIKTEKKEISKEKKEIFLLKDLVKKLRTQLMEFKKENKAIRQKKVDINKETKKIISFKEKRALSLQKDNNRLSNRLKEKNSEIKNLNMFIEKSIEHILIKKSIDKAKKGDILLIEDLSVLSIKRLNEVKTNIIIYSKSNKLLSEYILIPKKNLNLIETENFALVKESELNREIKKNKIKKGPDFIKNLLDEYKRERNI